MEATKGVLPTALIYGNSDAASRWAGWDLAHHITGCPPGFENLTASLWYPQTFLYQFETKLKRQFFDHCEVLCSAPEAKVQQRCRALSFIMHGTIYSHGAFKSARGRF